MGADPSNPEPLDLERILEVVYIYFNGDRTLVDRWLKSPHPDLDDDAPLVIIKGGQPDRLLRVIRGMLAEMEKR